MRRLVGGIAAAAAVVLMLTGCTSAAQTRQGETQNIKLTAPASDPPVGVHPTLTTQKSKQPVKISIIAIENNPFFAQVKTGYTAIKPKIEALGGKVEWINAGTEVNVDNVGKAINAAAVDGSNAIAALMPGDGICSFVRNATSDGILVAAYNGNATCSEKAGAVFFHGQDLYAAGGQAGELMCKATANLASASKPGKVGVETESFTFQALEDRRHGFLDALKKSCPWVTPVGDGIEYQGSTDRIASATRDFMTSTPNLVGIYVTGGNPNIAAETVGQAGKAAQVKVIAFDFTDQNVQQIKAGNLYAAIDQDPYGQSYDTIAWLYNAAVTHVKPSSKYFIPTKVIVGTRENIDQVTKG